MSATPPPSSADRISDRLDASFGDGPPPPPLDDTLGAGRRALRRRRTLTTTLAAAAAVVVVGLGATLLTGGTGTGATDGSTGIAPANAPTGTPTDPAPSTQYDGSYVPQFEDLEIVPATTSEDVELLADGSLAVADGVTVTQQVKNPLDLELPDRSLGIAYELDGEDWWSLLTYEVDQRTGRPSTSTTSDTARRSFPTLEDWLDDLVALQQRADQPVQLVEFAPGGTETLVPLAGVEILQQSPDVDLGAGFAGPDDPSAVAEVRVDGERWYVLARRLQGTRPQYLPTAAEVGGPTLDDFLAYASEQYAEGGGGLR